MISMDNICSQSGMHTFLVNHQDRQMELAISVPEQVNTNYVAIIGHPHPLMEGTMNNKVVTTVGRALLSLNIPVIRFNFRGVGQSTGQFAHGIGETEDMVFLIKEWLKAYPNAKVILAGFSFGSFVAYQTAQLIPSSVLILIAPPVVKFTYSMNSLIKRPDVVFIGDNDEVVDPNAVVSFCEKFEPTLPLEHFNETGHFFHGRLIELREAILKWIKICLPEL